MGVPAKAGHSDDHPPRRLAAFLGQPPLRPPFPFIMTRPLTATTLTAVLVIALVAGAAPAAAEHDSGDASTLDDVLDAPTDYVAAAFAAAEGGLARASYAISGPDDDAAANRDAAIETFNEYNTTLVEYANARDVHEGEVVQIDCTIGDETATAYIVAPYNTTSGAYESAEAVTSTDRTVDHTVALRGPACDNAAAEIETFHDKFAEPDKNVTRGYLVKKGTQYGSHVDEPFTGGDE